MVSEVFTSVIGNSIAISTRNSIQDFPASAATMHLQGEESTVLCLPRSRCGALRWTCKCQNNAAGLPCINRRGIIAPSDLFMGSPTGQAGRGRVRPSLRV